jgi:Lon protease-like protein
MVAQGVAKEQMPFTYPHLLNDCGWVANRWCELLPLSAGQREHLLGLANPRLRLDLIFDVLEEMGISNIHNNS